MQASRDATFLPPAQGTPHQLGVAFNKQPASLWRQHNSRLNTAQLSSIHEAALGAVLTQQLRPLLQAGHLSGCLGQQQAAILLQDGLRGQPWLFGSAGILALVFIYTAGLQRVQDCAESCMGPDAAQDLAWR